MNDVMDALTRLIKKTEEDLKKMNRLNRKQRRDEDPDDDITFVMQQRRT